MRRFLHSGLPYPTLVYLLTLVFIQGCARPVPQIYQASAEEIESTATAFVRFLKTSEEVCGCCLDAEADASLLVSGFFSDHTGRLTGYLQAMQPGYVKFVAVNPLGQPMLVFATDGDVFKSLNVFEGKAYLGSARSEGYLKFAPQGFEPKLSYYWLTGRLPPGDMRIQVVLRDREQDKFWLLIKHAHQVPESMVLFDPRELLILRHVLRDEQGGHLMDVTYADYQPLPGAENGIPGSNSAAIPGSGEGGDPCRFPASITVSTKGDTEKVEVKLSAFLEDVRFSPEDFNVEIPDNFQQLLVE